VSRRDRELSYPSSGDWGLVVGIGGDLLILYIWNSENLTKCGKFGNIFSLHFNNFLLHRFLLFI